MVLTPGPSAAQDSAAYLHRLGQAVDFSFEELQWNRAGQVHPAQQRKLGTVGGIVVVVVFLLMGVAGWAIAGYAFVLLLTTKMSGTHETIHWVVGGLFGFIGALMWLGVFLFARTVHTIRSGRLERISGPLNLKRWTSKGYTYCYLYLGRRNLPISSEAHAAIEPGPHHVYLCGDRLLSLEPASAEPGPVASPHEPPTPGRG